MTDVDTDDDWENYDSGPFCRHWDDPSLCDIVCARCWVKCGAHDGDECEWLEPGGLEEL